MITPQSITKEWLQALKAQNPKINTILLEKMIYALFLVESLKTNGLDFIFKGGTSLVLLLDNPQRLSIDIDIITQASQEEIETTLDKVSKNSPFHTFELDEHRSYREGVPKAHYKLFFTPLYAQLNDNTILLDILFDENPYPVLQKKPVEMSWLQVEEPLIFLDLPTVEAIAGDKLTAFAPNTTGIQYGVGKETEIIKQMFDLGQLFDRIIDFQVFAKSFLQNASKELTYRPTLAGKTPENVLQDAWQTCLQIAQRENKELQEGIKKFGNWTFYPFVLEHAIETAGKVALLVSKLLKKDHTALPTLDKTNYRATDYFIINTDFNFLNKKVKMAHYAMFYWHKAIEVYIS